MPASACVRPLCVEAAVTQRSKPLTNHLSNMSEDALSPSEVVKTFRPKRNLFDVLNSRSTSRKGQCTRSLWSASSPALLSRLHVAHHLEEHDGCVNTMSWNASGSLLVSGSDDCRICVWRCWDEQSAELKTATDTGHHRNIFCARFVPESSDEEVVTAACDGEVRWTNVSTGSNRKLGSSRQFTSKLEFMPQHSHVFIATGQDGRVSRYDLRTREGPSSNLRPSLEACVRRHDHLHAVLRPLLGRQQRGPPRSLHYRRMHHARL